ncbi:MAG: tlde1 domain-containing protein [Terriglobales bacterium]
MTHVLADGKRELAGVGYSGHGNALDDPEKQDATNQGPIPRGTWIIGPQRDHHLIGGKTLFGAMELAPAVGNTTRRSDFLIHGDSVAHDHSASKGCIVLPRDVRNVIARSGDTVLQVVHP